MTPEQLLSTPRVSPGPINDKQQVIHGVKFVKPAEGVSSSHLALTDVSQVKPTTRLLTHTGSPHGAVWSDDGDTCFFLEADSTGVSQVWCMPLREGGAPVQVSRFPKGSGGAAEIATVPSQSLAGAVPGAEVQLLTAAMDIREHEHCVSSRPGGDAAPAPAATGAAEGVVAASTSPGLLARTGSFHSGLKSAAEKGEDWVEMDTLPVRHWDTTDAYATRTHLMLLVLVRCGLGEPWRLGACLDTMAGLSQRDCPGKTWYSLADTSCVRVQGAGGAACLNVAAVFRVQGYTSGFGMMATTATGVHTCQIPLQDVLRQAVPPRSGAALALEPEQVTDVTHLHVDGWRHLTQSHLSFHASPLWLTEPAAVPAASLLQSVGASQGAAASVSGQELAGAALRSASEPSLLVWTAMQRPGFESDCMRLVVYHVQSQQVLYRSVDVDVSFSDLQPLACTCDTADGQTAATHWLLATAMHHAKVRLCVIGIRLAGVAGTDVSISYHWLRLPCSATSASSTVHSATLRDALPGEAEALQAMGAVPAQPTPQNPLQQPVAHLVKADVTLRLAFLGCSMRSAHELHSAMLTLPPEADDTCPPDVHPFASLPEAGSLSDSATSRAALLSQEALAALAPGGVPACQETALRFNGTGASPCAEWPFGIPGHALPSLDVPLCDRATFLTQQHTEKLELGEVEELWFVGGSGNGRRDANGDWRPEPALDGDVNVWQDSLFEEEQTLDKAGSQSGEPVHAWVLRPPGASAGTGTLPVLLLIHGGPQGAWGDTWHYRWHPQFYAAAGFLTVAVNFHGSASYGQAFMDAVSGDWGGAPQLDNLLGLRAAVRKFGGDPARMVAAGASFGGYSINWLNGHTRLFKGLFCHDGIFDTRATYFGTEEIWFPQWEFGGAPHCAGSPQAEAEAARQQDPAFPQLGDPDSTDALYQATSPCSQVAKWCTPTLFVHGSKDYRLPDVEGLAAFSALQRAGVKSKLLLFPKENHWVLRPTNSIKWHATVLEWLQSCAKAS